MFAAVMVTVCALGMECESSPPTPPVVEAVGRYETELECQSAYLRAYTLSAASMGLPLTSLWVDCAESVEGSV